MHLWAGRTAGALLLVASGALAAPPADPLDAKYGVAARPAYVKAYEADRSGEVLLNPWLQVATREHPALLEPGDTTYKWVIDAAGRVAILREAPHPLGRTYPNGFHRPEDDSNREPGYVETYGHVSALGGAPGRIGGEILWDGETRSFTVNNKSGRYTKHEADRTPERLAEAARLIREVVDPGRASWGPVFYLLDYAPPDVRQELLSDPRLEYDVPEKKARPYVVVLDGAPSRFAAEADGTPGD
jgi:alkylated DNA nucleotide flippase Atl1